MVSMNTMLNIEMLDVNIIQKHGVAQRRLKDKQPEEKTNCLVKEQEKEYQTGTHQQNGLVNETNVTLFAKVRCFLIQSGLSKVFWAKDTTRSTYLVNMSPSSAIRFKKLIDMLGFFGWLASIKQGILEPVKFKCIFLGYHKIRAANKLWRLDDVTSKVVLYTNIGGHTFEVEPQDNIDQRAGLQEVQTQNLIDYQLAPDRKQHLACELFGYREDNNEDAFEVAAVEKIYAHESLIFNNIVVCEAEICATKGLLVKAKGNILNLKIIRDQSGNTLRVSQSRIHNGKLVQTLLKGQSTLSLEDSLSMDSSAGVDMLDGFDRGLQTNVQVCVDFDYAIGISITVMSRSITGYGLMILGCAGSLKANLQHMEALLTTEAGYVTFTEA
nr:hypothetical protein [Tanacetum cinerariifolium]GEV56897.1 hypothetical protein [Tanacetum cinerariifolium]